MHLVSQLEAEGGQQHGNGGLQVDPGQRHANALPVPFAIWEPPLHL